RPSNALRSSPCSRRRFSRSSRSSWRWTPTPGSRWAWGSGSGSAPEGGAVSPRGGAPRRARGVSFRALAELEEHAAGRLRVHEEDGAAVRARARRGVDDLSTRGLELLEGDLDVRHF